MIDKSILKHGGLLAIFAIVSTSIVIATHWLTKDTIAYQIEQQRLKSLNSVIPQTYYDQPLTSQCIQVNTPIIGGTKQAFVAKLNGKPSAIAIESTATNGYSGNIDLLIGMTLEGTVLGVRVIKHKETPGLGDKIDLTVSNWILSFDQKQYTDETAPHWKVKKDGGQFDQFTGATITPRAVVGNVANTLAWVMENKDMIISMPSSCGKQTHE